MSSTDYQGLLQKAVRAGDIEETVDIIQKVLQEGINPVAIVDEGLIPAIRTMGDLFEQGEVFLPHLMRAAEALKKGMALVSPLIEETTADQGVANTVIMGTVEGDIHDIGKSIVALLLSASGFNVVDLGASVPVNKFIGAVEDRTGDSIIVGMSALLTTTMSQQKLVIQKLTEKGLREKVKVMVGGACVSREWAAEIGADGYGLNAQEAVRLALEFA
ncbi:corrinoid protein [candidate division CSSED10-310 bacterium]|uniref:Corrinoid protein n=1 Tax=candidate division CSSED10-310 bacterium TaxID=2855610 RepID=A0ABV6Z651_UNCC1